MTIVLVIVSWNVQLQFVVVEYCFCRFVGRRTILHSSRKTLMMLGNCVRRVNGSRAMTQHVGNGEQLCSFDKDSTIDSLLVFYVMSNMAG